MLSEVMRYYELTRAPVDLGYFETEHHTQLIRDLRALIAGGRLNARTAVIGSGKTLLMRRLRDELEREGRGIVSRSLTLERSKVTADSDDVGRAFRTDVGHLFRFKSAGRSD